MVDAPLLVKIDALLNHFGAGSGLVVVGVVAHSFKDAHHRTMSGLGGYWKGVKLSFHKNDSLEIRHVDFCRLFWRQIVFLRRNQTVGYPHVARLA